LSVTHLQENLAAGSLVLSAEVMAQLAQVAL
jgi:aryl-alcohol dehydrogenase-like predicted oxidoreductase